MDYLVFALKVPFQSGKCLFILFFGKSEPSILLKLAFYHNSIIAWLSKSDRCLFSFWSLFDSKRCSWILHRKGLSSQKVMIESIFAYASPGDDYRALIKRNVWFDGHIYLTVSHVDSSSGRILQQYWTVDYSTAVHN